MFDRRIWPRLDAMLAPIRPPRSNASLALAASLVALAACTPAAGANRHERPERASPDLGTSAQADRYRAPASIDSATQSQLEVWLPRAPIPVEIAEIAAAPLHEYIYTGGGFTPPGSSIGRWFGRYDTARDRWERRADLPLAVHHPGLAAADGRVWLTGGYTGLDFGRGTRRLDVYDPETDTWARKADMPGTRGAHFLVALDNRLYVVGGVSEANDKMWSYDIAADAWSVHPGAPTLREHLGAAASGGRIYVVAGRWAGQRLGVLEAYDPATGQWATKAPMPGVCGGCSAAATADGRIHVTGGEAGGGRTFADHFIYDPATDTWETGAEMPTARHGLGTAGVGGWFFAIGGGRTAGLAYSDIVERWEIVEGPITPTPSGSATMSTTAVPTAPPPTAEATPTRGATPSASQTPGDVCAGSRCRAFVPSAGSD